MSRCDRLLPRVAHRALVASAVLALVALACPSLQAQNQVGINQRAVGGVSIDPAGMLADATVQDFGALREALRDILTRAPDGLDQATPMRKISLRRLDEAIRQGLADNKPVPPEISVLGGLQQVRYVLVYPEQHDIVLVGPAEGWKVDDRGAIVGETSGRPVLLLDDLIVALRAAAAPVKSVISCSIDPTPEGIQRVRAHTKQLRTIGNPEVTAMGIQQQLGPQDVSVTGVPETSHFARVMVAADYQMKRIGMGTQAAPIRGLPSFMELMRGSRRGSNMLPRWWLAPDYEPILRDADGLAWELRGASVKAMTETDFFDAAGVRQESRPADPVSQKWADTFTERYEELAQADPVFGQLRDCMDLAIVAAMVVGHGLTERAQVELPMLMGTAGVEALEYPAPKHVQSKATVAKKGRNWMIACGGVQINAWQMVADAESSDALASVRKDAAIADQSGRWWD